MKIITTTAEDFVKSEIDEWGFDYVDDMFAKGYEPTLINGVWAWNVLRTLPHTNGISDTGSCTLPSGSNHLSLI